ncbi:Stress response protein nst1 [Frankliniella fusca]|uniref:Stress response protein nst1 n=1 Tax=Frankliniella fusca TaxID=407009 RepID=A0AAE1GWF9_9NEOP|nr:Stress response protein nst1 [Frankliniella fusca]
MVVDDETKSVVDTDSDDDDGATKKEDQDHTNSDVTKKCEPDKDDPSKNDKSSSDSDLQKKKTQKRSKDERRKHEKEPSSDEESSSDEEINKINKAASKIPTYKSIKQLVKKQFYKVLDLADAETSKGRTIRLKLEDHDVTDKDVTKQNRKRKAAERQRKHRKNLSLQKKKENNEKARIRMRSIRQKKTKHEKEAEKKQNRERRYILRSLKKAGMTYNLTDTLDIEQHNFQIYMKPLQWHQCKQCNRRVIQTCFTKFKCHRNCKLFTAENDMDPLDVPEELKDLTYIEKQLIARVHCVISLYRFKKCQYKYKGQVINFSQDVQHVADKLPHLVEDLNNVVVVKFKDNI